MIRRSLLSPILPWSPHTSLRTLRLGGIPQIFGRNPQLYLTSNIDVGRQVTRSTVVHQGHVAPSSVIVGTLDPGTYPGPDLRTLTLKPSLLTC